MGAKGETNMNKILWSIGQRSYFPTAREEVVLKRIASRAKLHQSGKRARFLLMYAQGVSHSEILETLKVSDDSLQRWWDRWIDTRTRGSAGKK